MAHQARLAEQAEESDEPPEGDDSLLAALGFDPVSLDALQARTGLNTPHLQAHLMTLELDDLIVRLPGGLFQRLVKT
jgi:DNA processing protein